MSRFRLSLLVAAACFFGPNGNAQPADAEPRAVLDKYCVTCHNQRAKTARLTLEGMDLSKMSGDTEKWEKVVRKLRTGAMPPAGMPRPEKPVTVSVASWLEAALDRAAIERPNPGRPTLHRLNRAEYRNAIRDLLALDIDAASLLPADSAGYGFDNNSQKKKSRK